MGKKSSGYIGDTYQMPKKNGGIKVLVAVILIVLALILVGVLALFGYLKSKEKKDNGKNSSQVDNVEDKEEGFSSYVSDYISNNPDYTFYFELRGKDIEKIIPSWLNYLIYINYDADLEIIGDEDDLIYIYGSVYGGGCLINVAAVDPNGYVGKHKGVEIAVHDADYAFMQGVLPVYGNKDGLYLCDTGLKRDFFYLNCDYKEYENSMYGKLVKVADNGQGRDINKELIGFINSLAQSDKIKLGVTPGGEFAFSCSEDYTYNIDDELGETITVPSGFSMYCQMQGNSGILELEGSSGNLSVYGIITRTEDYTKPRKLESDVSIIEYKDFKAFIDNNRRSLEGN